jgi:uncharacterized protein (TIGR03435 family)
MNRVKKILAGVGAAVLASCGLFGQPASPPAFEVASIRPAAPLTAEARRSGRIGVKVDGSRADFVRVSLADLIARAYRVRSFQVSGPDWMKSAMFDILAKMPEGASPDQVPEMLQALLAERFKLTLHRDNKEFPVYALIVGKGGPKLTARPADYDPAVRNGIKAMTLGAYAEVVSRLVDRPVIDKTELKGEYMLSLVQIQNAEYEQLVARARTASPAAGGGAPADTAPDPAGAGAFAIVQGLGLKLDPRKLSLPLLVIDHLEKTPTEN